MNTPITPYNPARADNISPAGKLHGRTYTYADLNAGHSRKQDMPMQGFDPHYGNIVDYILRCTYDIWERKMWALSPPITPKWAKFIPLLAMRSLWGV